MTNTDILKKKILYLSTHRGTKEMDIILGGFVKKYISSFNKRDLNELESLLNIDDEILYKWYLSQYPNTSIPANNITKKLKEFTL